MRCLWGKNPQCEVEFGYYCLCGNAYGHGANVKASSEGSASNHVLPKETLVCCLQGCCINWCFGFMMDNRDRVSLLV